MARLSDHLDAHKRTHTHGLNAVASDLRAGKIAYANGVKLIGQADLKPVSQETNGAIFLLQNPTGISSASYDPLLAGNGGVLIQDQSIKGLTTGMVVNINTNGYIYNSTSYGVHFYCTSARRSTNYARRYEMWGMTKNATPTTNDGVRILFNINHFWNQFWEVELYWNGSSFRVDLTEWNNPTATVRLTSTFSSAINWPTVWHISVDDLGDRLLLRAEMYESDLVTDSQCFFGTYNVASRPYKDATAFAMQNRETPGDEWLIRGYSVMDIPNA